MIIYSTWWTGRPTRSSPMALNRWPCSATRISAGTLLNVEIWQLATPADAYGLFSAGRTGAPAVIGNEGDSDPGRRLAFWQDRYFVSLNAAQPVPDETLQAFAQAISGRLPAGGERPALVDRLPGSGLVERSCHLLP